MINHYLKGLSQLNHFDESSPYFVNIDFNAVIHVEKGFSGLTHLACFGLVALCHGKTSSMFDAFEKNLNYEGTDPGVVMTLEQKGDDMEDFEADIGLERTFMDVKYHGPRQFSLFGLLCDLDEDLEDYVFDIAEALISSPNFRMNALSSGQSTVFEHILLMVSNASKDRTDEPSSFYYALKLLEKFSVVHVQRIDAIERDKRHVQLRWLIVMGAINKLTNGSIIKQLPREALELILNEGLPLSKHLPQPLVLDEVNINRILDIIQNCDGLKINRFVKMLVPERYHTTKAFELHANGFRQALHDYAFAFTHPLCVGGPASWPVDGVDLKFFNNLEDADSI